MTLGVFLIVIASSFFQAWWNFRLKKASVDRASFLLVGWLVFGLIATPVSLFFIDKPFEWRWMYFILATGFAQGLYLMALSFAYSLSDMSLVFPISRGTAVALSAVVLSFLGGSDVSMLGWCGVGAIAIGAMSTGRVDFKTAQGKKGLLLSVIIALIVCSYSVIDTFGAREIPIFFYVLVMNIVGPLWALPFIYKHKKKDILKTLKNHKLEGFLVGLAGSGPYFIVLWAFQFAQPAYILALREVSILFALFLGVRKLKEQVSLEKIIGIALILVGIVFIKMA